jgi:hypothetical protein
MSSSAARQSKFFAAGQRHSIVWNQILASYKNIFILCSYICKIKVHIFFLFLRSPQKIDRSGRATDCPSTALPARGLGEKSLVQRPSDGTPPERRSYAAGFGGEFTWDGENAEAIAYGDPSSIAGLIA